MVNRVQTIRYYTTLERPPVTEYAGELYINYADIQIGALDTSKSPVDFVAVRYYSQSAMYVAGDFAIYNGNLYRCLENNTTGAFDSGRWSYFGDIQEVSILINQETSRAQTAEQHLQDEINTEINNRIAGDTNLQNEIDSLTTAVSHLFPPGMSVDYYGTDAPTGWLLENGAIYSIATYPALAAILSNRYGGNGTTTFAVPNSLGRFGVSVGTGFPLGSMGGSASATLSAAHIPSHSHTIQPHTHTLTDPGHDHAATFQNPGPVFLALVDDASDWPPLPGRTSRESTGITIGPSGVLTTDTFGGSGGITTPISTLPPYISRTRIIKT